jgi:hypothetical protein
MIERSKKLDTSFETAIATSSRRILPVGVDFLPDASSAHTTRGIKGARTRPLFPQLVSQSRTKTSISLLFFVLPLNTLLTKIYCVIMFTPSHLTSATVVALTLLATASTSSAMPVADTNVDKQPNGGDHKVHDVSKIPHKEDAVRKENPPSHGYVIVTPVYRCIISFYTHNPLLQ